MGPEQEKKKQAVQAALPQPAKEQNPWNLNLAAMPEREQNQLKRENPAKYAAVVDKDEQKEAKDAAS